jgi:hypothetical protein
MNNLFKCNGCQKVMMLEEYNSHLCTPKPRGFKSVEIDYFRIIKGHMGKNSHPNERYEWYYIYRLVKRAKKQSDKFL